MLLLLALACDPADTDTCPTGGSGQVSFSVDLPSGDWLDKPIAWLYDGEGTLLATVESGDPAVTVPAGPVYVAYGNVRTADDGSGFSQTWGLLTGTVAAECVPADDTLALAPEYEEQPGSRHLWFAAGESVAGVTPEQLAAGGSAAPDLKLDFTLVNDLRGLAFDRTGNLWVATSDTYGTRLLVLEPGDLQVGGAVTPRVSITNTLFDAHASIKDLTFAPDGTLLGVVNNTSEAWVGVFGFTPAAAALALVNGDTAVAEPTWETTLTGLVQPFDVAVTAGGDAWITDNQGPTVLRTPVESLAGGGDVAPAFTLTVTAEGQPLQGPTDLDFAPNGDLVVDEWTSGVLASVSAGDLSGTGAASAEANDLFLFDVLGLPDGLALTGDSTAWLGDEPASLVSPSGGGLGLEGVDAPSHLVIAGRPF